MFSIHGYLRRLISLLITDDKATMESEGELKIILLSIVVANFPVCVYLYLLLYKKKRGADPNNHTHSSLKSNGP